MLKQIFLGKCHAIKIMLNMTEQIDSLRGYMSMISNGLYPIIPCHLCISCLLFSLSPVTSVREDTVIYLLSRGI